VTLRQAGIAALLTTLVLGAVSGVLFLAAFQLRLEWFTGPAPLVSGGTASAELLRWAAIADLFSYYLATAVVAYVLWTVLRSRGPALADFGTAGAFGYVLIGGAAASALAFIGPALMNEYSAPGTDQAAVAVAFGVLTDVVFRAIWQFLDAYLLAAWWLAVGLLLRVEQPGFARLSLGLAAWAVVGTVFTVLDLTVARYVALAVFFAMWTAWTFWLLVLLWRRRHPFTTLG